MSTFSVLNLNDSGPGSLREAISDANTTAGADVIQFAPELTGTISLSGRELNISDHIACGTGG